MTTVTIFTTLSICLALAIAGAIYALFAVMADENLPEDEDGFPLT